MEMHKTWKKKKRNRGKTWIVLLIPAIVLSAYFIFEENIQKKRIPKSLKNICPSIWKQRKYTGFPGMCLPLITGWRPGFQR